jgi:site-specific DNA-cytosine methylase
MNDTTTQKTNKQFNVLSLFDGLTAARISLDMANIHVDNYYSSEICKNAIQLQNFHYSADTTFHQIGDVKNINGADYAHITCLIGGFPCTNLTSINGKDKSGITGTSESSLFYEFTRIIREIRKAKPKGEKLYLLIENVNSMSNAMKKLITEEISLAMDEDIQPVMINASRCCGSTRRRLFWSNLPITQPQDKNITYQSCVKNGFVDREKSNVILGSQLTNCGGIFRYKKYNLGNLIYKKKEYTTMSDTELFATYSDVLKKSNHSGKSGSITDEYAFSNDFYRIPSISELSTLLSIPENYVSDVPNISKTAKYKMLGLTFAPCVISHILKELKNL